MDRPCAKKAGWQMFFSFLPREEKFFDLFEQAADNAVRGATLLLEMVSGGQNVPIFAERLKEIEHTGDRLVHETMERLDKTFITPIDHDDIHTLIKDLDEILDAIDAAALRMASYKVELPDPVITELAKIVVACGNEVAKGVRGLRHLGDHKVIESASREVNRLEHDADSVCHKAVAGLFESGRDPLTVIKLKEVYEILEQATDYCEDVTDTLASILLKNG